MLPTIGSQRALAATMAAGTPIEALQRHFGHPKPEMTMRYARVDAVEQFRRLDLERRPPPGREGNTGGGS